MMHLSKTRSLFFAVLLCLGPSIANAQTFPDVEALPANPQLPDPLKMFDGTPVTTKEQWYEKRRPEIKALFEFYMYGKAPPAPKIEATINRTDAKFFGGKATKREVTIKFGPEGTPPISLLLVVPNKRTAPAPVFVGLNFCGNHAVVSDPTVPIPKTWMYKHCKGCVDNRATEAGRGTEVDVWAIENSIDRGYAVATFYDGDIDPDIPDFSDGVHAHYYMPGQTKPGPHEWGTIAAWAWGLQRAVDYLASDKDIDKTRICAIGHSRLGKTTLLAAAFDERIALAVPHQSGTGGCALSRDNDQETVERITRVFPHWFNGTFAKFGGNEARLPIDQHLLMALVAPRPLLDTEGQQDKWANFDNAFRALKAADPVYKLLGAKGLVGKGLVEGDAPIVGENFGELMQYRRDTPHVLNKDYWNKILDFADKHFAAKRSP